MVGCLHDFKKLSFISTVGGFVSNREIERMSTHKACRDVIHSLFSFFMVLLCQVFSRFKLNQQFVPMVEFVDDKRVEYDSRFSICGDGHVLQTFKYKTANIGNGDLSMSIDVLHDGQSLESVYKSPILDFNIQIGSETNGYYPGCKDSYHEHLFGKDIHAHRWQQNRFEDRGIKHLYEFHHACTGDESCDFCNETTRPFGLENCFVENEEMCCQNSNPNYGSLHAINNERLTIDERNKKGYPSMLIPPPRLYDDQYGKTVYVSELIVDVSTDFVSPSTIQDPAYVSYDEDLIRIKFDQESSIEHVRRYGVLEKLNSIMFGYGFHEDSHTFTTLKYYLLSIDPVGGEFYENFVLDVVKYSLHYAMKKINECIGQVNKFRPIFSPSVVYLLKSLNVLRRSLDADMELTCIELISEKHGSLLGAMLSERHSLINDAGFNLNCLRNENASSSAIPTDHPTVDVHTKADKLQTMVVAFNVLFDVFKILNIELHRKKGNDFYSMCPTCTEGCLMKTERQSVIESIREYMPLNDCLIDFDEDPLRFEHISPGSIMFVDTQCGGNCNFVHGYMTQVDISRIGSNCDLVPEPYREITKDISTTQSSSIMNVCVLLSRMKGGVNSMLASLSNKHLNMQAHRLSSSVKSDADEAKLKRLQDHLLSDCKYNPFKFCNMSDNEKLQLLSFFTSIRDRSRYQACDRASTYSKETYEFNAL